ncbi:MAG TPA: hypothetical protein VGE59_03350 [Patescibacteria group bacterium]
MFSAVTIRYPSRLNAMAIDPSKIAMEASLRYSPGEVIFSVALFRTVQLHVRRDSQIVISPTSKRPVLIKHAVEIMRQALGVTHGIDVGFTDETDIRHCGLGSSSGTIAAVATAMNELYGNPIPSTDLLRFLAQNHGEEIDTMPGYLYPVQCIGGSAAAGLCRGGIIVLAGESVPIGIADVSGDYEAVIGIPNDVPDYDAKTLMDKEIESLPKFIETGVKYGGENAYNVLHKMLPAMHLHDLATIGDVIYEYRFRMGSIENCSFVYPRLPALCARLAPLKHSGIADVLAVSSVGPGIFAITRDPQKCEAAFKQEGLTVYRTKVHNQGYEVTEKVQT